MPLSKIVFKPGINREGTEYDNTGGWFDVNLVRFRKGRPEKFGGWSKDSSNSFLGTARALHAWNSLGGTKYLGVGTTWKYYIREGDSYSDVTPIRKTTTDGVTFSATDGSSTITATDTGHGSVINDFVTFTDAVSLGGLITAEVLNQEYQITSVTSNTYTFVAKNTDGNEVVANSSDTGNGGSGVDGIYQVNVGLDVYITGTGWSSGTWGEGTFGSTTALSATNQLRLWTHDHFGENLIINPRAGGIYRWVENDGLTTRAVDLSTVSGANLVPTVGLQVITSEKDRHLIVLGSDSVSGGARTGTIDPMLISFSDQENELEIPPLITNTAGDLKLSSGSSIIGATKTKQEILIVLDILS